MKKKISLLWLVVLVLSMVLTACTGANGNGVATSATAEPVATTAVAAATGEAVVYSEPLVVDYSEVDLTVDAETVQASIQLADNATKIDGTGATVEGNVVTITAGGTYNLSGELSEGQVVVNAGDDAKVVLVLRGVKITAATAGIYVVVADKVVLAPAAGTENTVTNTAAEFATDDDGSPNAAIYSHDDLTINGEGALTVNSTAMRGIVSKDDLKIVGGQITVNAGDDGLRGRDSIAIKDGVITVNAGNDGLNSNNDEDTTKGYIAVEGGMLVVTAGADGVQAETRLLVSGGELTITAGGGSVNTTKVAEGGGRPGAAQTTDNVASAHGLQAGAELMVTGGRIAVNSAGDALHTDGVATIDGGELQIAAGDDGIHATSSLTINNGMVYINESYEGLEAATITVNDGKIYLTARDDGINVAGGNDGSGQMGGFGGPDQFAAGDYYLYLNGGYIFMDAGGDGLDSNGSIYMKGGVVLVNGPTENMNGAIDYNGEFQVTGGFLVTVGSAGMAEAPSDSSTQHAVLVNFSEMQAAGTLVHIAAADGTSLLTFAPTKSYQSVVLSSPALTAGTSYQVYVGGSTTGTAPDGLYIDGVYTPGTSMVEFTVENMITRAGVAGGMPGGGGRPGGGMRP